MCFKRTETGEKDKFDPPHGLLVLTALPIKKAPASLRNCAITQTPLSIRCSNTQSKYVDECSDHDLYLKLRWIAQYGSLK